MYITDYFYLHHPLLIKKPDRPKQIGLTSDKASRLS